MDELGQRLQAALPDRYTIERELGRGGMATVFLAQDLELHRYVAIKVLRPEIANAIGIERFLQEIDIAAQLTHPHILPLFESGKGDGLVYYVMPYVEGESLRDRITREKQLPQDDAIRIAKQVAGALGHAHSHGIVHRDVKPGNIMLVGGEALVADFGIARAISSAGGTHLTETGVTLGTPAYMSPEQGGGEETIDGRSDLYSLGCVLFEMLAGEPPFTGPTSQVILARHQHEAPPTLSIIRSTVTPSIEFAVQQALAKVPADRPPTAERFVELLEAPAPDIPEVTARSRLSRRVFTIATLVVVGALGIALWRNLLGDRPALDDNRVMVFPMVETGIGDLPKGIGDMAAFAIGSALEETAPLQWKDGWLSLNDEQRANLDGVTSQERNAIARAGGARYRLDGSIVTAGDSASIILWLYDVRGDSLLQRKTVTGANSSASVMQLAILGVKEVLPVLLQPGRDVERISLEDRDLGAVALWMQGKREYRAARFEAALSLYERAIERDSALALAALDAAQAATWTYRLGEGERFIDIALAHESSLPDPMVHFAHGLHNYFTGNSDSAVTWLRQALESDAEWAEAHMALGEVFYHLMPSGDYSLDSMADAEFRAASADSNFSPPLFHLAEMAIRQGNLEQATNLTERYRAFGPSQVTLVQLTYMLECVKQPSDFDWSLAVQMAPLVALNAAQGLSAGARHALCAEGGFRAVLQDSSVAHLHFGAFQGLQGILLASGRRRDFVALVDSVVQLQPPAMTYYLSAAIVDSALVPKALDAEAFIRNAFGQAYENSPSRRLSWTMGVWHAHRGDKGLVRILLDALSRDTENRRARLFAENLAGRMALLERDSAEAISILSSQHSTATLDSLVWWPEESLSSTWLLLGHLFYASGRFHEAINAASRYDHSAPVTYPSFVAASLKIRLEAAQQLRDQTLVSQFRERLLSLGRSDLVAEP